MTESSANYLKSTILVVDDIAENLRILVELLSDEGYVVKPASNAQFAIDAARRDPPDLILLDIMMPEIDGFEACRQFKEEESTKQIPIIFITAKNDIESQTTGFDIGAVDYITKPFNSEVVLARIRTQLELKHHRNHLEELVTARTKDLNEEIVHRKEVEKNLRSSESKLRSMIDTFRVFIYTTRPEDPYRIDYMNSFLQEYLGYDGTGKNCYEVMFGKDSPCEECRVKDLESQDFVETEIQHPKDGKWYAIMQSRLKNEAEGGTRRQAIMIDITRQKEAELELREREAQLKEENLRLKESIGDRYRFGAIIGRSPAMQEIYHKIMRASSNDSFVSIYGESGTGKELVARSIHENSSRKNNTLVSVNCGAIPENLAESEFFGHVKGAFTGADKDKTGFLEKADGGTLFLDEIGEIGISLQIKLLRVLDGYGFSRVGSNQQTYSDFRIITATNKDLKSLVKEGVMREDFFFRIHVIPIHVPPLRERKSDIPFLVDDYWEKVHQDQSPPSIPGKIMEALQAYDWPGNVRELHNTLHRYLTLGQLDLIGEDLTSTETSEKFEGFNIGSGEENLAEMLAIVEKKLITDALNHNQWRRDKTANDLGITQKTLYRRMKSFQLID